MLTLTPNQLPNDLLQLAHPIKKLHIIGENFENLMKRPRLAVVGSRKISPYGRGVTENITAYLASKGVVIVSGLALGTDSIAHQACINSGGQTIAVMACGPDRVYPGSHTALARNIVEMGGVILTEYDTGHRPFAFNFLERNRIIAAMSEGVLVTEAAARSGSLNTANHALQLGKPVFAVPGNITNPLSAGCNNLIKAGAIPVTSPQDILDALKWQDIGTIPLAVTGNTDEERIIIALLKKGISDGADMLAGSGLPASAFNQALTMLEITRRIRPLGANHWSL
ncbi:DNA-processing protein DprA [soil metagenome]